jgi:hypothetical protein
VNAELLLYHRELFKMKKMLTAWDFDSSMLVYQITLINKDLFLQVRNTNLKLPKQKEEVAFLKCILEERMNTEKHSALISKSV